jgi:hypothetical protein
MWQLKRRGEHQQWTELGSFAAIGPAAHRVLQLEREADPGQPMASLFFRVYADPLMEKSDAEILSRLEYQGSKGFYLLTRQVQ